MTHDEFVARVDAQVRVWNVQRERLVQQMATCQEEIKALDRMLPGVRTFLELLKEESKANG